MKKLILPALFTCLLPTAVISQTSEIPRVEAAVEFSTLNREDVRGTRTEAGFGGRVTYNFNDNFAIEGAGYFFPRDCFDCFQNGRIVEGVGGLKAGRRFQTWGVFAKARPGFVRFTKGQFNVIPTGAGSLSPFQFQLKPLTSFATDLGGVLEFYPSRRIVTRIDAGDTLVHFKRRTIPVISFDPGTGNFSVVPFTTPGKTRHNFQFMTSVGFRF